jgi:hypothetical protein
MNAKSIKKMRAVVTERKGECYAKGFGHAGIPSATASTEVNQVYQPKCSKSSSDILDIFL